ncbi:capsid cement protein [Variovorax atrisoli]|uniref:capsid cement protein n=1 Tax=Variovorax atrisoli TaxID=3394203 RepID=UPI003399CE18
MRNELFSKNYSAEGAIPAYRIFKFGAADGGILVGAAATDKLVGITGRIAAAVAGDRIDGVRLGIAEVEYGGNVAAGDPLTSDATGRAVVAAPAAGSNVRLIGFAEVAGALGDIGSVFISPCVMQG